MNSGSCSQSRHRENSLVGTLRSDNGDGNKKVIQAIGLIRKTTTLHVHHTFLYTSFCTLSFTT